MSNTHPVTGIRYGVIACASLDPDLVQELFYGHQAVDLSYNEAYAEAKKQAEREADDLEQEATEAAKERMNLNGQADPAGLVLEEMARDEIEAMYERKGYQDRDDFIHCELEKFSDMCQIDEPDIEGEYEGVKYQIGWLGGAPLLWVIEGPLGTCRSLCSPCVPNAGDLDSGFLDGTVEPNGMNYICYIIPRDWLASNNPD